ncbi:MAG: TIGR04540 family protein [Clostridiales bacterium]|nr:TIGR04540 family protein [Clostridiales bacterium]
MNVNSFYKSQREVAKALNKVIDSYWSSSISENEMKKLIRKIYTNNRERIFKEDQLTRVVIQQCGKKRLEVLTKVISI